LSLQRTVRLPRFTSGPFKGDPYVTAILTGQVALPTEFKVILVSPAIASGISAKSFRNLFPDLRKWKRDWTPHIRMEFRFAEKHFDELDTGTSERFHIIEDDRFPEDVAYLNPNCLSCICEVAHLWKDPYDLELTYPRRCDSLTPSSGAILILGHDKDEGLWRLRAIQTEVSLDSRRQGILVRDFLDVPFKSVEEKMTMFAHASRFAVVDHTFPSGAIDELKICANSRVVTCVLKESGRGATWMQADYEIDYSNVKEFTYTMDPHRYNYLPLIVHRALRWAEARLIAKMTRLNKIYPWRRVFRQIGVCKYCDWLCYCMASRQRF